MQVKALYVINVVVCVLLLAVLSTGCTTTKTAGQPTIITYNQVVIDAQNAYAVLKAELDTMASQGTLPAVTAITVERRAEAALAVLASTGGVSTLTAQGAAQQALNALLAAQRAAPAALLPASVMTALQFAETALVAYLALDPPSVAAATVVVVRP